MGRTFGILLLSGFVFVTRIAFLHGQVQSGQTPLAFEVASIKPNDSVNLPQDFQLQPGGRVTITNFPIFQLIRGAYSYDAIQVGDQIMGGPDWIRSDRYDVVAETAGNVQPDELGRVLPAMLRSLLEDRFRVRTHTERRVMSVYLLVLASKITSSGPECIHRSKTVVD